MKRWPVLVSFLLFLALCASAVGWAMQWLKPAPRTVAAAPASDAPAFVQLQAASTIFGARQQASAPVAGYVLKGVIVARKPGDNVAIMAAEGKPPQALREGAEVVPGVTVKEVHAQFVLLSERGRERRVELPESAVAPGGGAEKPVAVAEKSVSVEQPDDAPRSQRPRERRAERPSR